MQLIGAMAIAGIAATGVVQTTADRAESVAAVADLAIPAANASAASSAMAITSGTTTTIEASTTTSSVPSTSAPSTSVTTTETTTTETSEPAVTTTADAEPATSAAPTTTPVTTAAPTTSTTTTSTLPTTTVPTTTTTTLPSTTVPTTVPVEVTPAPTEPQVQGNRPSPTLIEATSTSRHVSDHERRGTAALATIHYDWTNMLPGWTVEFHPGRSGVIGLTYTHERRIEIYVRDSTSDSLLRHVIAHELGHAIDLTLNSSSDRERWQDARGIGGHPWWPGNGANDFSTGAGDFAEAFAEWQVGAGHHRSRLGGSPNGDQLALLAELTRG